MKILFSDLFIFGTLYQSNKVYNLKGMGFSTHPEMLSFPKLLLQILYHFPIVIFLLVFYEIG